MPAQTRHTGDTAPDYVDSKRCTPCHREIAANYGQTGMARSFYIPDTRHTIEDYSKGTQYYHALSDSYYSMTERGGEYFQRRWQLDATGKEIDVEELRIDYVMGSGNHGGLISTGRNAAC